MFILSGQTCRKPRNCIHDNMSSGSPSGLSRQRDNVSPGSPSRLLMVNHPIQDQQLEISSPTTANSTVQDMEQEKIITDIATCYLDPEPELDMTKSESDRHGIQWSSWFGGNRDSEPSSFHTLLSL